MRSRRPFPAVLAFIFATSAVTLSIFLTPGSALANQQCEMLFSPAGHLVALSLEKTQESVRLGTTEFGERREWLLARRLDANGRVQGTIEYALTYGGKTLYLQEVNIDKRLRGNGLYRLMVAEILAHHPDIEAIEGVMGFDNYAVFEERKDLGDSDKKALKHTPGYHIRTSLGFTEVDWERTRIRPGYLFLHMTKP